MLSDARSQMSCRCRIESIVDTVTPCVLQGVITGLRPSTPRNVHDVSTAEQVCRDHRKSGKGMAQIETHRKDPKGNEAPQGAFRPLGVHGGLSSFVPRPGPLLRAVPQKESSEDPYNKKSPSSHRSSCPTRNAITSSYSSTRGCHPVQRKRGLPTSQASRPPRSPKKVCQESPLCPAGVPALRQKNQPEKDADTTMGQKAAHRNYSSPADCSRPRKRKFPLLPHRRGEPLRLPSPPEPGFRVTAEDLDREKRAALQRIQDALRGDTEATCSCDSASSSSALALPAAVAAPLPASDSQVTSTDCSRSSQPLLLGSHTGISGSNVASTQALSKPSREITASVTAPSGLPVLPVGNGNPGSTAQAPLGAVGGQWPGTSPLHSSPPHGQPAAQAPDPIQALSTAVVQLSLGSGTQAGYVVPLPASAPRGTHASAQPGSVTSSAALAPGAPAAPGLTAAPQLPGPVSHAGPNSQHPGPPAGSTMPAPISMGLLPAPPGLGRGDAVADLCSRFGALCIAAATSRAPSGPQGSSGSLGPNTGGRPRQSTLLGITGASMTNQPVSGAPSAPPFSHIPRHLSKPRSTSDGSSTSSKAACGDGGVVASPPTGTASLVSRAHSSLATKTPSSPAQRLIKCKRAAPCNKPSSSTLQPTAAVPGLTAAPQLPGAVSHAGPNSQHPGRPAGSTMLAPISMGLSAAPPGLGRGDDVADLCSRFGALCIAAATSRAPSGPQGSRASLGLNTGGRPGQSTLSGTTGASTTNQPVSGAPSTPPFSHIPRHLSKLRSTSDGSSTSSKAACGDGGVVASPPTGTASLVSMAHTNLATKTPSSPAQRLIKCKRAAPCNKPSSSTLQPTAAVPGLTAAPQLPGAVSHAGPNSQHPGPPAGSTMPAPISMGLSAAPPGLGRGDDVADLCSRFGALCIAAATSRAPSGPQGSSASLGPNTGGRPRQSTLFGITGASMTNQPVSGAPSAPPFSHIPRHLSKPRSTSDGSSTSSKAACGDGGVVASPPTGTASLVSRAHSSLATKTPSSPAQRLIKCKRAAPCNKPSSSTLQPTAAVPGLTAAPQLPGAVSHAGPNSQHPGRPTGSTMLAPISMGLSAAPPGLGRGDDVADLCSRFGALCIAAATSRAPSGPQGSKASLGLNTGGRPGQSTLSGTTGASTTNQPVSGAPSTPPFSHIPRHLSKLRSTSDGSSTSSKAACGDGGVVASPPTGTASLVSMAHTNLATKTPSSPAQRLIKCKRAAPCNKPSSSTLQPTAAVPGLTAAPQLPGAVSHAGPNSQHPSPPAGSTMPAPISMGLSAAPPGLGRGDDVADLCSRFGALCIAAATSRAPSGPQGSRASLGANTGGRPRQSTLSGTTGASTTNQPVSGAPSAPPFSHIPRHLTKQRSTSDGSSTSSKAACGDGGVVASPPTGTASLVSTAHTSLTTKTPSSPAQHRRGRKRAAPSNKPSPSTTQPTFLGPKRQRLG